MVGNTRYPLQLSDLRSMTVTDVCSKFIARHVAQVQQTVAALAHRVGIFANNYAFTLCAVTT